MSGPILLIPELVAIALFSIGVLSMYSTKCMFPWTGIDFEEAMTTVLVYGAYAMMLSDIEKS